MNRRKFLQMGMAAVGGAAVTGAAGLSYANQIETEWLAVEELTLALPHLPPAAEGLRVVHLTDLHLYPHTQLPFIQKVVAEAIRQKPDVLLLTGDYVTERADAIFELAPVLAQINPTFGTFATLGNHDHWTNAAVVTQGLREAGIVVLDNQGAVLGMDWLYVAGVDDCTSGRPDVQAALAHRPAQTPTILLAHEPDTADWWAADGRIQLQLSGHTHGGQICAPGYGPLVLPNLGHKYAQGLFQVEEMLLYTSRGIGVVGLPLRFNCRPEMTVLTLVGG